MTELERLDYNVNEILSALTQIYSDTPMDISVRRALSNGTYKLDLFKNVAKYKQELYNELGGVTALMGKDIYVSAANGDDLNTGNADSPFKTIKKAFDVIPNGAKADIILLDSYTWNASYWDTCKVGNRSIGIYADTSTLTSKITLTFVLDQFDYANQASMISVDSGGEFRLGIDTVFKYPTTTVITGSNPTISAIGVGRNGTCYIHKYSKENGETKLNLTVDTTSLDTAIYSGVALVNLNGGLLFTDGFTLNRTNPVGTKISIANVNTKGEFINTNSFADSVNSTDSITIDGTNILTNKQLHLQFNNYLTNPNGLSSNLDIYSVGLPDYSSVFTVDGDANNTIFIEHGSRVRSITAGANPVITSIVDINYSKYKDTPVLTLVNTGSSAITITHTATAADYIIMTKTASNVSLGANQSIQLALCSNGTYSYWVEV